MGYAYAIGLRFDGAGTVAHGSGDGVLNGTGTAFLTEFKTGDLVIVNGVYRVVFSVTSDTLLGVAPDWDTVESGQAVSGYSMQNLETALSVAAPKSSYQPYSTQLDLGDGSVRGAGWPEAEWRWGYLTQAQRDALRDYVSGAGAAVAIYTETNEDSDAFAFFLAQAIWPPQETKDATRRIPFVLRFRALVEVP